jgi:hypothetical protein
MRQPPNPSTGRIATGYVLSLLGAVGVAVSSFHSFDTLVFYWPYDRLRLLRLVLIFSISTACLASGALLFHNGHWWRDFLRALPLYVLGLGSVGLISYVWSAYDRREPSFVTAYETVWLVVGLIVLLAVLLLGRVHFRRRKRRPNQTLERTAARRTFTF